MGQVIFGFPSEAERVYAEKHSGPAAVATDENHAPPWTQRWDRASSSSAPEGSTDALCSFSASSTQGPISLLQEFVQGSRSFPAVSHCSVLQWAFHTRSGGPQCLFMAIVAFLLDGVPHHVAGGWQPSKKLAQRDAAERALRLFVANADNEVAKASDAEWQSSASTTREEREETHAGAASSQSAACWAYTSSRPEIQHEVQLLDARCQQIAATSSPDASDVGEAIWSVEREGGQRYRASVEVNILGVPHTFCGPAWSTPEDAFADTARRALWYLQTPGYEDAFEPSQAASQELQQHWKGLGAIGGVPALPVAAKWLAKQRSGHSAPHQRSSAPRRQQGDGRRKPNSQSQRSNQALHGIPEAAWGC